MLVAFSSVDCIMQLSYKFIK